MKLIMITALVAFAVAAPRPQEKEVIPVAIISEESVPIDGAYFSHRFEADNGISQSVDGSADESGAQVMTGSYNFPLPDGSVATFDWVADAAGFRVESPLLPVAPVFDHPIPAHVQEQIDFADAQLAAGLIWNQDAESWV